MNRLWLLLALALPAPPATAQTFVTEAGHVAFTSHVPLHTFTGESERLVGEVDLAARTVDFYVDLGTLRTGIGKRDRDMRQALETDRYPFAEFYGRLVMPFDTTATGPQPVRVRGRFTIHGVARDVEVTGTLAREDGGLRVRAAWTVGLDDHGITAPRLLIVKVADEQEVEIDALLRRKGGAP